ncbi:hypothetical protein ABW20_dc0109684 [Dactylellina cionopaga]|nr:hypothetical protein ABW20_dc0109684 [Dactylellina cionopaga]
MLEVLLPPSLATHPGNLKSHNIIGIRLPGLQPSVQTANIFSRSTSLSGKEEYFPINVNIKMALPLFKGNPKMRKDDENRVGSSVSAKGKQPVSKLMIPQKEKFLPGFKGFDPAVGLPASPTETTISHEDEWFPISPPLKRARSESLPGVYAEGLPRSMSELQLSNVTPIDEGSYVPDGFRPRGTSMQNPPSYDAIYGGLGQGNASATTNEAPPLPSKQLHTVPSVSLFRTPSMSSSSSPSTTPISTPSGPLLYARFPETSNVNPRRISLPTRAPSTPGLTHSNREMLRIQIRSSFSQLFKAVQFSCNDTEKCLVYEYSDISSVKVPWNIPIERLLRQLWQQVMEYDAACGKSKPASQGGRELATYHAIAMGLMSSGLSSETLCMLWDRSLAFTTPARRECVEGWLSFTEFVAVVWMVGMAATDPSFK